MSQDRAERGRTGAARCAQSAMLSATARAWRRLSWRGRLAWTGAAIGTVVCVLAAVNYMADSDGLTIVNPARPGATYLMVFLMIALDAVIPIFPGETTLNAASTAAAEGSLELVPVMVMGALGAIVGDSALFWLARRNAHRIQPQLDAARAQQPGAHRPRRHELQRTRADRRGALCARAAVRGERHHGPVDDALPPIPAMVDPGRGRWSVYTCVLAYNVALALGDFPLASVVISGLVTTAAIGVVFLTIRDPVPRT